MSLSRSCLAALFVIGAAAQVLAQGPQTNLPVVNISFIPTNGFALITDTTNRITVKIDNFQAFTNLLITGLYGTNQLNFLDNGTRPGDDTADDGMFGTLIATPITEEVTNIEIEVTVIGTDLASITNDPPAPEPIIVTNMTNVIYFVVPRPRNDNFTNAFRVASGGAVILATNNYASIERREPVHASVATVAASVWWNWSSPATTNVLVDLAGTDFPAVLAVYRGTSVSNLVAIGASTNDLANRLPPNVSFPAELGATFRIAVSGIDSNAVGDIRLRIAPGATPDTRAPAVAISSPGPDALVTEELVTLVGTARELLANDSGVQTVLLQINGGPPTNAVGAESWALTLPLPPGTNVVKAMAVDFAGNQGPADSIVIRYVNPTNDYFANAIQLQGTASFEQTINGRATREAGEPLHAGNDGGHSIWYWWRAPAAGELLLTTSGSDFDTLLAVYVGGILTNLTEVVSNDDEFDGSGYSQLNFIVTSNVVYRIAVDGYAARSGNVILQHVFTPLTPGQFFNVTLTGGEGGAVSPPGGAFPAGARAMFTALPEPNYAFADWQGSLNGTNNPLEVVVSQNLTLRPRFQITTVTDGFESGDLQGAPWETGNSPGSWTVRTNDVATGRFAALSGPIGGGQTSNLTIVTNTGAGTASFSFRVSSERTWDFFEFALNGTVLKRWSGEIGWTNYAFRVNTGTNRFEWRYTKDGNFIDGEDLAILDDVYLPPPSSNGGDGQPTLSIVMFPEGAQITLQGEPGRTYQVEASTDFANWSVIASRSSASGVFSVLDLQAVGQSRRFYRARAL